MSLPISIGDVLLLSSLAWKIGCAFTSGRAGAPAEFREVENELQSLKASLSLLADTLDADDSILSRADRRTVNGLGTILSSCNQTLKNLESLVSQYQAIRKMEDKNGVAAPRVWRDSVLRNYKKLMWTSEGGNIQALRDMLDMHVGSINVMNTALQSQSLARLENTIHPMASKVDGLHDTLVGNIDVKIAEMHNLIMTMSNPSSSPLLSPVSRRDTTISMTDTLVTERHQSASPTLESHVEKLKLASDPPLSALSSSSKMEQWPKYRQVSNRSSWRPVSRGSATSSPSSTAYGTPPTVFADSQPIHNHTSEKLREASLIPTLDLPQPAITTADPVSSFGLSATSVIRSDSNESALQSPVIGGADIWEYNERSPIAATPGQHEAFEHAIFDNAVTLWRGVGASIDYTSRKSNEENPGEEVNKVIQAMQDCDVSIVTKMCSNSGGRTRHVTSIWALSKDRKVRMQQPLKDDVEVIPYTIWGRTANVILRVPTELTFHDIDLYDRPLVTANTSWVNYHFRDDQQSSVFQSALMWKRLLYSFRTHRTMLAHESFVSSTFSLKEQLCGFENLRLWRDEEAGFTVAMIHYSPNIHEGYLTFRLGGPGTVAKAVDDGEKWVKIKRLNIVLESGKLSPSRSPASPSSQGSGKRKSKDSKIIAAIKIEFSSIEDKYKFLEICGKVRGR